RRRRRGGIRPLAGSHRQAETLYFAIRQRPLSGVWRWHLRPRRGHTEALLQWPAGSAPDLRRFQAGRDARGLPAQQTLSTAWLVGRMLRGANREGLPDHHGGALRPDCGGPPPANVCGMVAPGHGAVVLSGGPWPRPCRRRPEPLGVASASDLSALV